MRVLITGASGLIGSATSRALVAAGHEVVPLSRSTSAWDPGAGRIDLSGCGDPEAVIHLAGENIADGRWTRRKRGRILTSRVGTTRLLVEHLSALETRPRILIAASAVGYYGDGRDRELDETAAAGNGFLADVCASWEAAARQGAAAGMRVVNARFGMVLSRAGGALAKMLTPFRLGLGGRLGGGRQYVSWVSLDDAVAMLLFLLETESLEGPVNLVAPKAVTNAEFTRALGRALGRPTPLPVPAFALRALLGEMADALLLAGARVVPRRLTESGYRFRHADLPAALRALLG